MNYLFYMKTQFQLYNSISILIFILFFYGNTNAQTGTTVVFPSGYGRVNKLLVDQQHKYMYTVNDAKVVMWNIETGKQLYTFQLTGNEIMGQALSNDGKKLIIKAKETFCFSTETGELLFKTTHRQYTAGGSLVFSPDDSLIYMASTLGLTSFDARTGNQLHTITSSFSQTSSGDGNDLFFTDNNTRLVVPMSSGWEVYDLIYKVRTYRWDMTTERQYTYGLPQQSYVTSKPYRGTGVQFWEVATGKLLKEITMSEGAHFIVSENSKQFVKVDSKLGSTVYNTDDFNIDSELSKQLKFDFKVDYIKYYGKENIAFALKDDILIKLDVRTGKTLQKYEGKAADYTSELFGSLQYKPKLGIMNVVTDKKNMKTIDLDRMRLLRHKQINVSIDNVSFSPTGDTIAVFDNAEMTMTVKNTSTLKTIKPILKTATQVLNGDLYFFSYNGDKIFYAEQSSLNEKTTFVKYDIKTGLKVPSLITRKLINASINSDNTLMSAREYAYGIENTIGTWNLNTGKRLWSYPIGDGEFYHMGVSADKKFALALIGSNLHYFDMTGKLISKSPTLMRKEITGDFPNNPQNFGISSTSNDLSFYAFSPDYNGISDVGEVFIYKRNGELLHRIKAHSSSIRNILFSPNDQIIYTISSDQTIKIWRTETGTLVGTLYLFKESNDFVFMDPDGRFDGTSEGIKQIYFIRNRNLLPIDRLLERYYQPNLYARLIIGEKFDPIPNDIINPSPIAKISYEQKTRNLTVEDDKPSYVNTTGLAEITVNATAEADKVDEIRLFHNGKAVNLATRGLFVTDNTAGTDSKKYSINLLPGQNTFRAVALNSQRTESLPDEIVVNYQNGNQPIVNNKNIVGKVDQIEKSATLHLLVVGINKYINEKLTLNYAIADATSFKNEIEKDASTVLAKVKTYFITDLAANKKAITDAFLEIQKTAKPEDVFVFYYAGHGVISEKEKEFYLVPTDVADLKNVDEVLKQKGISAKVLQNFAVDIQAQKQLFILDACQSAGVFEKLITADANQQKSLALVSRSTGTHWMAASGSQQFANEFSSLGHGAFTYVLLQALKGEAAENKMITVNGLKNFLQLEVPALMKKYNGSTQYPASYGIGNDFPVEIIK